MKEEIFITLGCGNSFDLEKFKTVENSPYFCKPHGGLWSSPENSKWGWKQWVESEMPEWMEKKYGLSQFRFRIKPGSKIYQIDSVIDLIEVPHKIKTYGQPSCFGDLIDFEQMAAEYDGILLTERGQAETRWSDWEFGMSLYGWDCESLLVLRPDCIEELHETSSSFLTIE